MKTVILGPGPKSLDLRPVIGYLRKYLSVIEPNGEFFVAIALTDVEGLRALSPQIHRALDHNVTVKAIAGIDLGLTEDTMRQLVRVFGRENVFLYHNSKDSVFHPKMYIIRISNNSGIVVVGSSNLTGAGLSRNFEINIAMELDLTEAEDGALFSEFHELFENLSQLPSTTQLDTDLQSTLATKLGLQRKTAVISKATQPLKLSELFKGEKHGWTEREFPGKQVFLMSLSYNDVSGVRFDEYVRIPKNAVLSNPSFWGWSRLFHPSQRAGHQERFISLEFAGARNKRRLYYVEPISEFRLVLPDVYNLGARFEGTILKVTKNRNTYFAELVLRANPNYGRYLSWCTETSPRGAARVPKVWGYV